MATIKTRQGDTWDMLAKRVYGDEHYLDVLLKANLDHRKTVLFPAGVVLNAPEVDTEQVAYNAALPIWKRTEGEG
ncbi:MAG: tail protein X [Candidatus Spyradenecus sp.]